MSDWIVERDKDRIISTRFDDEQGVRITRILSMTLDAAKKQVDAVKKELERASNDEAQAKHNMTPEGRKNIMYLEKQKLQMAQEEVRIYKGLLGQYEKAISG